MNKYLYLALILFCTQCLQIAKADTYQNVGKLIDSTSTGGYGYGPAIIFENGTYNMFYCSNGGGGNSNTGSVPDQGWDDIRYVSSSDGKSWTIPIVVLSTSNYKGATGIDNQGTERSTCDPSVVRYQAPGDSQPYYYLFYSGAPYNVGTAVFVARSTSITGPFAKWTGSTWQVAAPNPKAIITPHFSKPDSPSQYGAGEQTVVVVNGQLKMWYSDDSTCATSCYKTYMVTGSPTQWSPPADVNGTGTIESVDVKFDDSSNQYVMYETPNKLSATAYLARQFSADGINWTPSTTICASGCFPANGANVGVSGDNQGHLIGNATLVVYAAPHDATNPNVWGQWDLFGGTVMRQATDIWALASATSNNVLWPASAVIDANYTTSYSSNGFPSSYNSSNTFIASWLNFSLGSKNVKAIRLYARTISQVPAGFPKSYQIYLTTPTNSAWQYVGTFSEQPDVFGIATITLSSTYTTYGVQVVPTVLGTDDHNNYYFQLNEIELVK